MQIRAFILLLLFSITSDTFSQDDFRALEWKQSSAYFANLMFTAHEQYARRAELFNAALSSRQRMEDYCNDVRKRYMDLLGEMPERCPQDAETAGIIRQDGFSIEKIIFKSTKGRYVTANLYLPEGKGRHPAVLIMCGHGLSGKAPENIEPLLARNGIAVMVVDPISQGERWQLMDSEGNYATRGVTTEHTLINAGCVVVGSSLAALQVWDNSCAITYLTTRNDIDSEKIGAFGSSGGGTQTAYLVGFDKRIKAAAICSYFSSRERTLELSGPSDGCQHIPGEGSSMIELEDFVLMMAPKPVLIMSGKYDFVDIWGAVSGFHNLQRAYSTLGAGNAVEQIVTESGHGMNKEKRNKMTRFLKYWLCGNDSTDIAGNESMTFNEEESYCTPKHQVNLSYADAVSIPQANLIQSEKYKERRKQFKNLSPEEQRKLVLGIIGLELPVGEIKAVLTGKTIQRDYTEYRYELIREGQMPVPMVVLLPDNATRQSTVKVVLDDRGKSHFLSDYENYHKFITEGTIIAAADLCGRGETEDLAYFNDAKYRNREYRISMTSLHIGKPLTGQHTGQIKTLVDFFCTDPLFAGRPIALSAHGLYGPAAIHSAFLFNEIKEVEIQRAIKSYNEFITNPLQKDMFSNVLYGVLKYYDLPELAEIIKTKIHYLD